MAGLGVASLLGAVITAQSFRLCVGLRVSFAPPNFPPDSGQVLLRALRSESDPQETEMLMALAPLFLSAYC